MKKFSPYLITATVTLASMMELLDVTIVNVAVPTLMGGLGASVDEIAWVSTAYVVANVIVLPISGWLSVYYGRRPYYIASIFVFVLSSLGCALSTVLWQLVTCRLIQGLAGGGLLGISQAMVFDAFPKDKASTGLAIYGVGILMGPTLGPLVGGYLIDNFSWHWIFLINIPIGFVAIGLAFLFIHNSPRDEVPSSIDYLGFALLAIGIGSLQILLERGERWDWFESDLCVLFATTGCAGLLLFIWWERRVANPMVDLALFKHREFSLSSICAFCIGFGLYGTLFIVPVFLQTLIDKSAYQSGLIIFPGALASAASTLIVGKLSQENKIDERIAVMIGIAIYCYAMYLHAHFTLYSNADTLFWPLIIRGFGLGLMYVPLTNLAMRRLPPGLIPTGSGVINLMRQFGGSVGISIAATLYVKFSWIRYMHLAEHVDENMIERGNRLFTLQTQMTHYTQTISWPLTHELRPIGLIYAETMRQAQMLGFTMLFSIFASVMAIGIPALLLIRRAGKPDA